MNEANASAPSAGNYDANELEGSRRLDFYLNLFRERRQHDRIELEERERSSHEEDMRFRRERESALRASQVRERRFWTLINALLVALIAACWICLHG